MSSKPVKFWIVLASLASLVFVSISAVDVLAQQRLDLKVGESNWTEPQFPAGTKAIITTTNLTVITPFQMADVITGASTNPTITISNVTWTGDNRAGGTFAGGTVPIGIASGGILSSGNIASVIGGAVMPWNSAPNTSTWWGNPGDPLIGAISGFPTFDAAKLQFDITSTVNQPMVYQYVFGSECYLEWVGTQYNDGFGIWVNGANIALIPPAVGAPPVTINTVFPPNPWYMNNAASNRETELDGLTQNPAAPPAGPGIPVVSLPYFMAANTTYTVEIVIADASDGIYDSASFIKALFNVPVGACDLGAGDCVVTTDAICSAAGGNFQGDGTDCGPTGQCCINGACVDLTQDQCQIAGGSWQPGSCQPLGQCEVGQECYVSSQACCPGTWTSGEVCVAPIHEPSIPTLSEWGMIVLLVLLAACAIIIVRRRQATA